MDAATRATISRIHHSVIADPLRATGDDCAGDFYDCKLTERGAEAVEAWGRAVVAAAMAQRLIPTWLRCKKCGVTMNYTPTGGPFGLYVCDRECESIDASIVAAERLGLEAANDWLLLRLIARHIRLDDGDDLDRLINWWAILRRTEGNGR